MLREGERREGKAKGEEEGKKINTNIAQVPQIGEAMLAHLPDSHSVVYDSLATGTNWYELSLFEYFLTLKYFSRILVFFNNLFTFQISVKRIVYL
jgi:hypothetical protein